MATFPRDHGSYTSSAPPIPTSAHGPARPRRPPAPRRLSTIYQFMTIFMKPFLGAGPALPQAAAQPPEVGPIFPTQDLNVAIMDNTPLNRGEPPGGMMMG